MANILLVRDSSTFFLSPAGPERVKLFLMKQSFHSARLALVTFVSLVVGISGLNAGPLPTELQAPDAAVRRLATDMKFTEGPVWLPEKKTLVFSDIPNSKLMQWSGDGGLKEFRVSENSNGNLLDREGRLLTCQHSGRNVVRTERDGTLTVLVDAYEAKKLNSPNDLAVKSDGTIWLTDPSYGLGGAPGELEGRWVYRFDPASKALTVVSKRFDMPNGIVFSPDEKRLYISDTGKLGKILAFDVVENGTALSDPVFEIDVRSDGMCADVKGNLYTTTGKGVQVFNPEGKEIGVIAVDEQPANACFGGDAFTTLFITARTSLYAVDMKVAGSRVRPDNNGAK
ncbi:MAG: SMP-30/gluconolactonase/LRE family protein [Verrucomicrobia bacterium]|nr:SMP-30/gluconolactonase/LRE family protein [Verrucomicrobiota bacterium]